VLRYREHGGFRLSEVGLGCYSLGGAYGRKDPEGFKGVIDRAHELGVNFFDTAPVYGEAERVLGEALKPYREEVYIATKVGLRDGVRPDLSRDHVKRSCEGSLRRLKTHYVDLYQVHFDDPRTPVEETVSALEELVDEGKVRRYGVGHLPAERVEAYCEVGSVFSVLMELSAVARSTRETILPLCRRYGVGAIAFSTTGRGLLTGKIGRDTKFEQGDIRKADPLFQRENLESGLRVAERFMELGEEYGRTPVQVAISWVLSHREVICALTGPSTIPHLEENLGGSGWSIPQGDLKDLEALFTREDAWLRRRREESLRRILSTKLPDDPSKAFQDLVYVMETAVSVGSASEEEIVPVFRELWEMRGRLDEDASLSLAKIQRRLRKKIRSPSER